MIRFIGVASLVIGCGQTRDLAPEINQSDPEHGALVSLSGSQDTAIQIEVLAERPEELSVLWSITELGPVDDSWIVTETNDESKTLTSRIVLWSDPVFHGQTLRVVVTDPVGRAVGTDWSLVAED